MYYYKKITTEICCKLQKVVSSILNELENTEPEFSALLNMILMLNRKLDVSKYLVIKIDNEQIEHISIWNKSCDNYIRKEFTIEGFPLNVHSNSHKLHSIYKQLINCFKDGQDRLQEQESSGTESREGCCIYGRGNRPQLATGRHCNEAQAQGTNDCSQRNQVVISTRCAEILGSKI